MLTAKQFLVCVCFVALAFNCNAQQFLALDKNGKVKRVHFNVNDVIKVKLKSSKQWVSGSIKSIGDSVVTINGSNIPLSDIKLIRVNSDSYFENYLKAGAILLPAAGVTLLAISAINSAVNDTYPMYSPGLLVTAGALIASGPVLWRLTYHQYRVNDNHPLKVIDLGVAPGVK